MGVKLASTGLNITRLGFKIDIHLKRVSGCKSENFALIREGHVWGQQEKLLKQKKG